jgi:hypothetical protein
LARILVFILTGCLERLGADSEDLICPVLNCWISPAAKPSTAPARIDQVSSSKMGCKTRSNCQTRHFQHACAQGISNASVESMYRYRTGKVLREIGECLVGRLRDDLGAMPMSHHQYRQTFHKATLRKESAEGGFRGSVKTSFPQLLARQNILRKIWKIRRHGLAAQNLLLQYKRSQFDRIDRFKDPFEQPVGGGVPQCSTDTERPDCPKRERLQLNQSQEKAEPRSGD